jgi:hypothetical protein
MDGWIKELTHIGWMQNQLALQPLIHPASMSQIKLD